MAKIYARQPHREQRIARVKLALLEAGENWLTCREVAAKVKPVAGALAHIDSVRFDLDLLLDQQQVQCRLRDQRSYEWSLS